MGTMFKRGQIFHRDSAAGPGRCGGPQPGDYTPLVDGGRLVHKLRALMHGTCNAANAAARAFVATKLRAGEAHFGAPRHSEAALCGVRPCGQGVDQGHWALSDFADIKGQNPVLCIDLGGMSLLLSISELPDSKYVKSLAPEWGEAINTNRKGKLVATMGRGAVGRRFQGKGIMSLTA